MHFNSAHILCFIAINVVVCEEKSYAEVLRDNYLEVSKNLINFSFNLLNRKLVKGKKEPSIAATTTTTEKPSPCTLEAVIFDEYFNYIKHVCQVDKKVTYANANTYCESKSMKLFLMTTVDELDSVLVYATERFPAPDKYYWIKGQKISGTWFLNTNELLIDKAIPTDASVTENCLSIANLNGAFITKGNQCDSLSDGFFCEFIRDL